MMYPEWLAQCQVLSKTRVKANIICYGVEGHGAWLLVNLRDGTTQMRRKESRQLLITYIE